MQHVAYGGGGHGFPLKFFFGQIISDWETRRGRIGYIVKTNEKEDKVLDKYILQHGISKKDFDDAVKETKLFSSDTDKMNAFMGYFRGIVYNYDGTVGHSSGGKRSRSRSPRGRQVEGIAYQKRRQRRKTFRSKTRKLTRKRRKTKSKR